MALTCNMPLQWHEAYFNWLAENVDQKTGLGREGTHNGARPIMHHLAGWFHYIFNNVYAHRPFPNAEAAVDSCIELFETHLRYNGCKVYERASFAQIDWVFLINRASMQTGHRRIEVKELMREFAEHFLDFLENDIENIYKTKFDDLNSLFGVVCAVSELQLALPD